MCLVSVTSQNSCFKNADVDEQGAGLPLLIPGHDEHELGDVLSHTNKGDCGSLMLGGPRVT